MKTIFIITRIMKSLSNTMIYNETLASCCACEKIFHNYIDAENHIKTLPQGIYQIQKIFVIE